MAKKSFKLDFNVLLIIAFVLIGIVLYCSTFKEGLTKRERRIKYKEKRRRRKFLKKKMNSYRGGQELLDENGNCIFSDKGDRVDETYTGITLCDNINPNTKNPGRYTYKEKNRNDKCPTGFRFPNRCHPDEDYRNTCVKRKIRNQFCDATNVKQISIKTDYLYVPNTFVRTAKPKSSGKCPYGYHSFRNRKKNNDGTNIYDEGETVFNILTGRYTHRYKRGDENKKKTYAFYKQGDKDEKGEEITEDTLEKKMLNDHPELFDSCIKHKDFVSVCKSLKTKPKKVIEVEYDRYGTENRTVTDKNPEWYDEYYPGYYRNCVTKLQDTNDMLGLTEERGL